MKRITSLRTVVLGVCLFGGMGTSLASSDSKFWAGGSWLVSKTSYQSECVAQKTASFGARIYISRLNDEYGVAITTRTMQNTGSRREAVRFSTDRRDNFRAATIDTNGLHGRISIDNVDKVLIDAFKKSNDLLVGVDGESDIFFSLAGSTKAISQLDKCYETLPKNDNKNLLLVTKLKKVKRQLSAANNVISDMRENWTSPKQTQNMNSQLSELRSGVVPSSEHEKVLRQLEALNSTLADTKGRSVPLSQLDENKRQLSASNSTLADLTEKINFLEPELEKSKARIIVMTNKIEMLDRQRNALNETVTRMEESKVDIVEYNAISSQLSAANQTIADIQQSINEDYIPLQDFLETSSQLSAANQAIADIQQSISDDYVPLQDFSEASRQVSALNQSITVLTERSERLKSRWLAAQQAYDTFVQECKFEPRCARVMELSE